MKKFNINNLKNETPMNALLQKAKIKLQQTHTSNFQLAENYLNAKYVFRYNTVKGQTEMREKNSTTNIFEHVNKNKLNTLVCELERNHIEIGLNKLYQLMNSDYSPKINPIREYFESLPEHKTSNPGSVNYIEKLAKTVIVENNSKWEKCLTRWLVAVVANAMDDNNCQNHTCLVLTGHQGKFKTTWLNNLAPKKLQSYIYTGNIDPNSKDALSYLAEFLFINIDDQLRQLNKEDENKLKSLITAPSVKYRRPYDPFISEHPHNASFMASVNGNEFLTDPSGSRRFLPFEVIDININEAKSIDMDKVWEQAYSLFKSCFIYNFNSDEVQELIEENKYFHVTPSLDTAVFFIQEVFEKPQNRSQATNYYTNDMIKNYIKKNKGVDLNDKKIGEALVKLGYEKWQRTENGKTSWVYSVKLITDTEHQK